jgi:hypothetical protein
MLLGLAALRLQMPVLAVRGLLLSWSSMYEIHNH